MTGFEDVAHFGDQVTKGGVNNPTKRGRGSSKLARVRVGAYEGVDDGLVER